MAMTSGHVTAPSLGVNAEQEDITAQRHPVHPQPRKTGATKLREMLSDRNKMVVCPGVYDGLTTRIALQEGFDCLYMTGAGTSISRLGMADLGLASLNDMRETAEMIANIDPSVPLIADADTGYGGPIMVGRTIQQYNLAGVAALHLEDQVVQKRCGHLKGKEIVSEDEYLARIRAAVSMRTQLGSDIVIIARTDALATLGLEAAISRMQKAVALGADVAFVEAIETLEQARYVCEVFKETPVMYGMVQGSMSPHITVAQAQEIGFQIIVYAALCLGAVYESVTRAVRLLKQTGDAERFENGISPHAIFKACGMDELIDFDRKAGGVSFGGDA